jgi:ribonuclease J
MKIQIHRGQNQIGGNIIEIATGSTKILFDVGLELDDEKNKELPPIVGLFDYKGYDAVFISHYHGDHMGLAYDVYKDIPIYMGENSFKIVKASDVYKGKQTLEIAGFFRHKEPVQIGDIKVTPFLCDHSAFDSYMLLAEAQKESVLYTGDFRSNGRKPFEWLLRELPAKVDTLICEGTTLSREGGSNPTEKELEEEAVALFRDAAGPVFVLQSSMNIDRIVTMYRAAKRCGRIFLEDLYMAEITQSVGGSIPNPLGFDDVSVFMTKPYRKDHFRYQLFDKYGKHKMAKSQMGHRRFVMCVRSTMLSYLQSLHTKMSFAGGLLVYSFWSGYRSQPEMRSFLEQCEQMGLRIATLHTSGHADEAAIRKLIETVHPTTILPVHTENPGWFG